MFTLFPRLRRIGLLPLRYNISIIAISLQTLKPLQFDSNLHTFSTYIRARYAGDAHFNGQQMQCFSDFFARLVNQLSRQSAFIVTIGNIASPKAANAVLMCHDKS